MNNMQGYEAWRITYQSSEQAARAAYALANELALRGHAPSGWRLVPDHTHMTDEQAEAIAGIANCCGGIAYDIYRAALEAAPVPGAIITKQEEKP